MNPIYLIAALASTFYGSADFYGGMAAKRAPAPVVTFATALVGLPVLMLGLLIFTGAPTPRDLAWSAAAGAFGGIAAALIYRALAIGPMSVASPVLSLTGMSLPVLVGFALGERPSAVAVVGLALAAVAILLLSVNVHGAEDGASRAMASAAAPAPRAQRVIPVALAAGLAAGAFLVCIGRIERGAGILPLVVARLVAIGLFGAWILTRHMPAWPAPGARRPALASGLLDALANIAYLFAVQRGSLALVAALVSLSPATAVLMARAILGERWSVPQRWGIGLALAAGACISTG